RHIGDALLADFAERLRKAAPGSVGRIGDDEVALLVTTSEPLEALYAFADIGQTLARPFWFAGQVVEIGVTIGAACATGEGTRRDDLMRRADLTLRVAKRKNRGGLLEFTPALESEFSARSFIEREL